MRKHKDYTDQDILNAVPKVKSMAGLLKELGLKFAGGNYANMKRNLQRLDADCSHWTGQGWNKDQRLKDWSDYTRVRYIKKHLIEKRGNKCEKCGLDLWQDKNIPLEVHHKDGDRTNNSEDNLILLCCNCHALTKTWRGKKNKNNA